MVLKPGVPCCVIPVGDVGSKLAQRLLAALSGDSYAQRIPMLMVTFGVMRQSSWANSALFDQVIARLLLPTRMVPPEVFPAKKSSSAQDVATLLMVQSVRFGVWPPLKLTRPRP